MGVSVRNSVYVLLTRLPHDSSADLPSHVDLFMAWRDLLRIEDSFPLRFSVGSGVHTLTLT